MNESMSISHIENPENYRDIIKKVWFDVIKWGESNMRDFAWRRTDDIYRVLIAEIMLHRTKASQVEYIYEKFIKKYPGFKSIIEAGIENIKSEIFSLGLSWRADMLYQMSENILEKYDGNVPPDKGYLMSLPGVGSYIASAVLCFGYNLPEPVLDTNTVRVIGRIFGIKINDSSRRSKKFEKIMKDLIEHGEPKKFSLSLIDFAARICKPNNPMCGRCPLREVCSFGGKR